LKHEIFISVVVGQVGSAARAMRQGYLLDIARYCVIVPIFCPFGSPGPAREIAISLVAAGMHSQHQTRALRAHDFQCCPTQLRR
jgi:hypothetical protein